MSFKDNWNRTDEICPNCKQVTKRVRGLTKQNLKRLITPKFDLNEILITFMIIMVLLLAYVYNNETKVCRDWLKKFEGGKEKCLNACDYQCELIEGIEIISNETLPKLNMTYIIAGMNETIS